MQKKLRKQVVLQFLQSLSVLLRAAHELRVSFEQLLDALARQQDLQDGVELGSIGQLRETALGVVADPSVKHVQHSLLSASGEEPLRELAVNHDLDVKLEDFKVHVVAEDQNLPVLDELGGEERSAPVVLVEADTRPVVLLHRASQLQFLHEFEDTAPVFLRDPLEHGPEDDLVQHVEPLVVVRAF